MRILNARVYSHPRFVEGSARWAACCNRVRPLMVMGLLSACGLAAVPVATQAQGGSGFEVPSAPGRYYTEPPSPSVPTDLPTERLQPQAPVPVMPGGAGAADALGGVNPYGSGSMGSAQGQVDSSAANKTLSGVDLPVRYAPSSAGGSAVNGFSATVDNAVVDTAEPPGSRPATAATAVPASQALLPSETYVPVAASGSASATPLSGLDYRLPAVGAASAAKTQSLPTTAALPSLKISPASRVTASSQMPFQAAATPAIAVAAPPAAAPIIAAATPTPSVNKPAVDGGVDAPIEAAVMRAVAENLADNLIQVATTAGLKGAGSAAAPALGPERARRAIAQSGPAVRNQLVQFIAASDYIQTLRPAFARRLGTEFSTYEIQALNTSAKAEGVQKLLVLSSYGPITEEVLKRDFNPIERDDVMALLRSLEWRKLQGLMARFFDSDLAPVTPLQQQTWETQLVSLVGQTPP